VVARDRRSGCFGHSLPGETNSHTILILIVGLWNTRKVACLKSYLISTGMLRPADPRRIAIGSVSKCLSQDAKRLRHFAKTQGGCGVIATKDLCFLDPSSLLHGPSAGD
jgi:hypothetical protein